MGCCTSDDAENTTNTDQMQQTQIQTKNNHNTKLYVIGFNKNYVLGLLTESTQIKALTELDQTKPIQKVYCLKSTSFFADNDQHFWSVGYNGYGQCGVGSDDENIFQMQRINYFEHHNIKINKIWANIGGECIFWRSQQNKLYGNGFNKYYNLGINDNKNKKKPKIIHNLHNVFDAAFGTFHSLALCGASPNTRLIIEKWLEMNDMDVLHDITNLIQLYLSINNVYSTGDSFFATGAHGHGAVNIISWTKIQTLCNKHIIQVASGSSHSLFLDADGSVFCCGKNHYSQLGIGHSYSDTSMEPTAIPFFMKKKIPIKHIECGKDHNIAIDDNGNAYSWGDNRKGQCGDGTTNDINEPKLIETLKPYKVINIKCGSFHSYALTDQHHHYLFGGNEFNECTLSHDDSDVITLPFFINHRFKQETNDKTEIKEIFLGRHSTMILTENLVQYKTGPEIKHFPQQYNTQVRPVHM
eukprot:470243_1